MRSIGMIFLLVLLIVMNGCSADYCKNDGICREKGFTYDCIDNKCVDICSLEGYCIFDMTTTPEECNYTRFGGGMCKCTQSESWCAKTG